MIPYYVSYGGYVHIKTTTLSVQDKKMKYTLWPPLKDMTTDLTSQAVLEKVQRIF